MPRIRKIRRRKINQARKHEAAVDAVMPSRFQESRADGASRIVIIGEHIFNVKLSKLVENEEGLEVVATASTAKEAMAIPNEYGAELAIVDVDFGGISAGIALTRDINERSPGCAFMLICGLFTSAVARNLWVYSTESWSVISQATAKNPRHLAEAISSAVHGITWIEPGITRELQQYGERSKSLDERKLSIYERQSKDDPAA